MRGFSLVLLSALLAGCGAVRDAFTTRAEVVARANDQALSVERLAAWTSTSKQVPLEALAECLQRERQAGPKARLATAPAGRRTGRKMPAKRPHRR